MSDPIIIASLRTLEASRFTLFKAEHFGKVKYLCDDNDVVHICSTYKNKTYYLGTLKEVVGSPFDFIVGLIRDILAIVGVMALLLHIGFSYGGFYRYLATVYPNSAIIQFLGS